MVIKAVTVVMGVGVSVVLVSGGSVSMPLGLSIIRVSLGFCFIDMSVV